MDGVNELLKKTQWEDIISLVSIVLILAATFLLVRLARKIIDRRIEKAKHDTTQINFLKHLLTGLIYFLGGITAVFQVPGFKNAALSILASSGILAVIAGFASQQTFANIVSGLFISVFKPFRIGDRIRFLDKEAAGIVEDITLRHTVIRTYDNKRVIVPNDIINKEMIENETIVDEKTCRYVDFNISLSADIDKAMAIIRDEIMKHPEFIDNRTDEERSAGNDPAPVRVIGFTDTAVRLRGYAWAKNAGSSFSMGCDLNKSIKERFDAEGIELALPQRVVFIKQETSGPSIGKPL